MTWPQTAAPAKVELLINGTWTDISAFVYQRDPIVITGGNPNQASKLTPAKCTMTLDNRDGRFSPGNASGAYAPYLVRNVQLRVSQNVNTGLSSYSGFRFWGKVPDWPPQADVSQTDVYVQITASGPLRELRQGGGKGSALTRYYNTLTGQYAPIAYWPCEEDPDATILGAGIDGGTDMTVTSGTPLFKAISDFNGSAPIAVVNRSSWDGLTGSVAYSGDDLYTSPGVYAWTCPPGISTVDAIAIGGGAGGGGGGTGGGGGGEYAEEATLAVTPGNSYQIVVGAGGSGARDPNASGAGGNTTITGDSKTVTAHGAPSVPYVAGGGSPGTGSTNTIHHDGGSGAAGQTTGTQVSVTLTGSGTWKAPTGVTSVQVECWGAGGGADGGGKAGGANSGGFGGGGGAYSKLTAYTVVPGNTYSFTIGSGGTGGSPNNNGTDGGDTHWVSTGTCLAKGGKHSTGSAAAGGAAASGVGNVKNSGGNGGTATGSGGSGGGGAAGASGAGGNGGSVTGSSGGAAGAGNGLGGDGGKGGNSNSAGSSAQAPGGGGGGGGGGSNAGRGTYGQDGQIILTYTSPTFSGGGGGASGGSSAAGTTATTQAGAALVAGGGNGGNGAPTPSDNGSSPTTPPGGGGGGLAQTDAGATAGNGSSGSAEMIYTPPAAPTNNVVRFIVLVPTHGGNDGAVLLRFYTQSTVIDHCDVTYGKGGKLRLQGFNSSNVQQFDSTAQSWDADGQPMMVSCELVNSGTSIAWTFKAVTPGSSTLLGHTSGTVATASISNVTEVKVSPNGDITKTAVGHISVQYALIDLLRVSRALNGHVSEMSIDRFIRLCAEQGLDNEQTYGEGLDHWDFEAGAQSWAGTNGNLTQSSGNVAGAVSTGELDPLASFWQWPTTGSHSLLCTCTGTGTPSANSNTGTNGQPVQPGDIVSVALDAYTPAALTGTLAAQILWYTSAGAAISTSTGTTSSFAANQVQTLKHTATAPATAAFWAVGWTGSATEPANRLIYTDNVRVHARMGQQQTHELHRFLEEIKDLEQGMMKESRKLWGFGYRTRISLLNQSPVLTLDYSLQELGDVLAPVSDDTWTKNDITVHRHKGSKVRVTQTDGLMSILEPPNGAGRYRKHLKLAAEADEQLLAHATHLLNIGTDPGERYPTISVALHRSEAASLVNAVASVEIGDYVQIINLAFWYPSATVKQLVTGYTETITPWTWDIVWNCMNESPYEITAASLRRW